MSVLWGIPYLFIKIAVEDGLSPWFLSWARLVLGAAVLLALAWRAGKLAALAGRWRWIALFAVVEISLPFPLIAAGEQHVSSSLTAILIAAVPLFVALLALRFDAEERVGGMRLVGLVVGLAGVVALVGIDVAGRSDELLGALAILLAALGYAAGPMVLKSKLGDVDARATMGASLAVAALVLTLPAALTWPSEAPTGDALVSIVVLGLFCTALAFVLWSVLIAEAGPGRAAVITYVAPVVAIALGVAVLDEEVGLGAALGLVLILAGSWLATGGRMPRAAAARG
jgi:drug/metabolite transporter (DMT)-like permease